jgi:uncharacterized repeat protein (TIGR03803 family)
MPSPVSCFAKTSWGKSAYALLLLFVSTATALPAQTFTSLHNFDGTDGYFPYAGLVQATTGNLYGTTSLGAANGSGSVFKITPGGTLTTVYNFCSQNGCPDGSQPNAGLIQATNGDLYGTTLGGGNNGYGTVFKITPSGTLTTVYRFCALSDCADGYNPQAGLVQATNGDFYGTTLEGGAHGYGTIFQIKPTGALTTLHSFDNGDGAYPSAGAGLMQASNGNLYGTTSYFGTNGGGTVFEITPSGTLTTLYSFCKVVNGLGYCTDGERPLGGLVQTSNGDFYGTTETGGANDYGTVFKLTPAGVLTTLYNFCSVVVNSECMDGASPVAGLTQATNGNFYGTTAGAGALEEGTIFEITPSGTLTTVYNFGTDGANPGPAALAQDTNGTLYGTTEDGGDFLSTCPSGCGTVFSLSVSLGAFVETQTTSGKVGAAVKILGTGLTGATVVKFNGTAATFTVVSSSLITTTVPTGATSGFVKVTTPSGVLTSNKQFRVVP